MKHQRESFSAQFLNHWIRLRGGNPDASDHRRIKLKAKE